MRVLSILWVLVWALGPARAEPEHTEPHALVISGGVSLGAYEAGLNWGLLAVMRFSASRKVKFGDRWRPELTAVTGASAGSINAVLSALAWCAKSPGTIEDNLFHHTWMALDLAQLMPNARAYDDTDALLSRGAMDEPIRRLECRLKQVGYDPKSGTCSTVPYPLRSGCKVPIGVMVSRIRPAVTEVAGLAAPSQRFVVPLLLSIVKGKARFTVHQVDTTNPLIGNVIYLPVDDDGEVSEAQVFELLKASSAFPLAFGPLPLDYCLLRSDRGRVDTAATGRCMPGWGPHRSYFVDGGVFDNVPLGVAQSLAEGSLTAEGGDAVHLPRVHYLYLDPGRRRAGVVHGDAERAAEGAIGLRAQLGFLGGFVETARNYELQAVLRFGGWNGALRAVLDRLGPSTAEDCRRLLDLLAIQGPEAALTAQCEAAHPIKTAQLVGLAEQLTHEANACAQERKARAAPLVGRAEKLTREVRAVCSEQCDVSALLVGFRALEGVLTRAYLVRTFDPPDLDRLRATVLEGVKALAACDKKQALERALAELTLDPFGERQLTLSDRLAPLVGSQLLAFGAFLGRPFRLHDYMVGVYDAIYSVARHRCRVSAPAERSLRACVGTEMGGLAKAIKALDSAAWRRVTGHLAPLDRAQLEGEAADDAHWAWARPEPDAPATPADRELEAVIAALHQETRACPLGSGAPGTTCVEDPTFEAFAKAIRGKVKVDSDVASEVLMADEPLGPLLVRAIARQAQIERVDADKTAQKRPLGAVLGAAGFLITSRYDWPAISRSQDAAVRRGSNGTVPPEAPNAWHLIPNRLGVELSRAGGALAWEPGIRFRDAALRLGIELSGRQRPIDDQKRVERDNCLREADRLAALGDAQSEAVRDVCAVKAGELGLAILPEFAFRIDPLRPFVGFLGIGVAGEAVAVLPGRSALFDSPTRPPFGWGLVANLGFLEDKLRVTVRKRMQMTDFAGRSIDLDFRDGWITLLSFNDLGGLIYWLTR